MTAEKLQKINRKIMFRILRDELTMLDHDSIIESANIDLWKIRGYLLGLLVAGGISHSWHRRLEDLVNRRYVAANERIRDLWTTR